MIYSHVQEMARVPNVGIVDYGAGNNFSVCQALVKVGLKPYFVTKPQDLRLADGLIIPGVGAFPEAIKSLANADMISPLKDYLESAKPVMAVCLGFQLLMSESYENGWTKGFGIFEGSVEPFSDNFNLISRKVPHIGWQSIYSSANFNKMNVRSEIFENINSNEIFQGIEEGDYFYFVHSYRVRFNPDQQIQSTITTYGPDVFVSSFIKENISAFQFHPEKSGRLGLRIYKNFSRQVLRGL